MQNPARPQADDTGACLRPFLEDRSMSLRLGFAAPIAAVALFLLSVAVPAAADPSVPALCRLRSQSGTFTVGGSGSSRHPLDINFISPGVRPPARRT